MQNCESIKSLSFINYPVSGSIFITVLKWTNKGNHKDQNLNNRENRGINSPKKKGKEIWQ